MTAVRYFVVTSPELDVDEIMTTALPPASAVVATVPVRSTGTKPPATRRSRAAASAADSVVEPTTNLVSLKRFER